MKISLVMIVKNEEHSLGECLKRAAHLVDEIVIADTGSTDRTRAVAEGFGAKVYDYNWADDFAAARNFALSKSGGEWNLILDADEYLRPYTRSALEGSISRLAACHGKRWIGAVAQYDTYPDGEDIGINVTALPRLLPAGVRYTGMIHELPDADYGCYQLGLISDHDGYLREGKGERNLPYLELALKRDPDDMYYHYHMAITLRKLKRLPESLKWFRTFYAGSPQPALSAGNGKNYRTEGILLYLYTLLDIGSPACLVEAMEIIGHEEGLLGGRADFCFVCGIFYMKLVLSDVGRYVHFLSEIEACYQKCLAIGERPEQGGVVGAGSFKAAYNLGLWYEVSGQMEKASRYFGEAAKLGYGPARQRLQGLFSH